MGLMPMAARKKIARCDKPEIRQAPTATTQAPPLPQQFARGLCGIRRFKVTFWYVVNGTVSPLFAEVKADRFAVSSGYLVLFADGEQVATFAPGAWHSVGRIEDGE